MNNSNVLTREKLDQATNILDELGIDLWLTFVRETSLSPDPVLDLILGLGMTWRSAFLISRTGHHTAIVGYYEAGNVRDLGLYSEVIAYHKSVGKHILAALDGYKPEQIAINYSQMDVAADGLSHGNYLSLLAYLDGSPYADRLISAESIIGALRGRKTASEVHLIKAAIKATEALFSLVGEHVRPGMSQREIALFAQERLESSGMDYAWDKAHNPIVTCGPHSAIGHAVPGEIILEPGHTLHLDLGVKLNGYCSDIQRMWYVPEPGEKQVPSDVQHAFDTVRGAIEAAEKRMQPGTPAWQVDEAARQFVIDAGYPEYMHATGHLLGRMAHDGATVLGPRWDRYAGVCELPVEADNVFTLELHVVVPDRGIMSLEEDVLVTPDGVEYLSLPQRSLWILGSSD